MAESKLAKLRKVLSGKIDQGCINYVVPDLWNAWDYDGEEMRKLPSNELLVNPYRFYCRVIEKFILPNKKPRKNYGESLSKIHNQSLKEDELGGDWIRRSVLYSTMIRSSSAWDHDRSFSLDIANFDKMKETGTFVKMLALLPLIKKIGIDTIYLLPLSRFSLENKKGELGSPYGVASFFDLDPNLKDPLTGNVMTVEDEFKAFVEACHVLDMRVLIDIIPRTNAIANDLIKDHPDWFYWIEADSISNYKVPYVEGLPNTIPPEPKYMQAVYDSDDVLRHIHMFRKNPKEIDSMKWQKLLDADP
ncbi:MAG: alpha-amylase, partial [Bacilli bacterium]|nr:alpha-amylase [Bacilli bacterium]